MFDPTNTFRRVDNGGEGGSDDYALDCWGVFLDGFKDARCADYGGVEEIFLSVCDVEVELQIQYKLAMLKRIPFTGLIGI